MIYFNKGDFKECLSWFNRAIAIKLTSPIIMDAVPGVQADRQ